MEKKKDFPEGKVLLPYSGVQSFLKMYFGITEISIVRSVWNAVNTYHLQNNASDNRKCMTEGKYFSCENILPDKLSGAVSFVIWLNSGYKRILHDQSLSDLRQDLLLYFYANKSNLLRLYKLAVRRNRKCGKKFFGVKTFLINRFRKVFMRKINNYLYAVNIPYRLQEKLKKANLVLMGSARVSNSTHKEFTKIVENYQRDTYRYLSVDTIFHIAALKNFRKRLSRIEQQMIDMRLDGHEISFIASKLGKSSGYIRNLNSGINKKLSRYEHP